jgi:hypothetical protein
MRAIVTVKLERNPKHDPSHKKDGMCPVSGKYCTDITGQHHSFVVDGTSIPDIQNRTLLRYKHITRIEVIDEKGDLK